MKNKNGFTLVEVILTVAILMIVTVSAMQLLGYGFRTETENRIIQETNYLLETFVEVAKIEKDAFDYQKYFDDEFSDYKSRYNLNVAFEELYNNSDSIKLSKVTVYVSHVNSEYETDYSTFIRE